MTFKVELIPDDANKTLRWLSVSHNGNSWSSIPVRSTFEAYQIIHTLQEGIDKVEECPTCHGFTKVLGDGTLVDCVCVGKGEGRLY